MGFLLGKSNQAFTAFECTGQNIKFSSGIDSSRSINKSLQTYQFREKGEFGYEFNYMTDAQYRAISALTRNRNSLRDGLFLVPIPYSHEADACVLLPSLATHHAYAGTPMASKPWEQSLGALTLTELSSGDYTKIVNYDSNYISQAAAPNLYNFYILSFSLSDFIGHFSDKDIRRISLIINGMNSSPIRFFAYNHYSSAWYNIDDRFYHDPTAFDTPGVGSFSLHKQLVASFSLPWGDDSIYEDYLQGGTRFHFMITTGAPGASGQQLMIQYARALVNGYWVTPDDSDGMENFSTAFTGAGRQGSINLLEV